MSNPTYREELDALRREWFIESGSWKRDDPSPDDFPDDVLAHPQRDPLPLRVSVEWNGPAKRPVEVIRNFWSRPFISFADAAEWLNSLGSRIPAGLAAALSSGELTRILKSMRGRMTKSFNAFLNSVQSLRCRQKIRKRPQASYRGGDTDPSDIDCDETLDASFVSLSYGGNRLAVQGWLSTDYQYG